MKKIKFKKANLICILAIAMGVVFLFALSLTKRSELDTMAEQSTNLNESQNTDVEEFEDDNFIVVLDKSISGVNKVHDKDFLKALKLLLLLI